MLKRLNIQDTAAIKATSEIPVKTIKGTLVRKFNKVKAEFDTAEAELKACRVGLLEIGLPKLFVENIGHPASPVTSIKLVDDTDSTVRLTFMDRYSPASPDAVDAVFKTLGADSNEFVQETAAASFDSKIFLVKSGCRVEGLSEGDFNMQVFVKYTQAIEQVTKQLIKDGQLPEGTPSPLTQSTRVLPKPGFHAERWANFPGMDDQQSLTEVLKNVVTLTPQLKS